MEDSANKLVPAAPKSGVPPRRAPARRSSPKIQAAPDASRKRLSDFSGDWASAGVSRESVRLMACTLGAKTGHARQRTCTRARRKVSPHVNRIIRRASEAGPKASSIYRKGNEVTPRALTVEGQKVAVSPLWHDPRLAAYRIKVRPWNGTRFVIYYTDELSYLLIVPVAEVRPTAGRPRSFGKRGGKGK
jgi:hypothetical protein